MSLRSIATACHCEAVAQHLLKPWLLNARLARSQGTGGLGPRETWPKVVSYTIRTPLFRSAAGLVFGPFLGIVRAPCRCVLPFWRVRSGTRLGRLSGVPKPWPRLLRPRSVALPKLGQRFFLQNSDAPFSAPRRPRFGSVFGPFGAAVPLRFPVLKPWLRGLVFILAQTFRLVVWVRRVALPKHSSLTIPCQPNRRGRRHSGR